jgi:hypothetical protein
MRANARAILIDALGDAHRWLTELLSDPRQTLESLASREGKLRHREFVMAAGEMTAVAFTAFLIEALERMKASCRAGSLAYIRRLLIHGARATVARVRSGQMKNAWLSGLLSRRHFNVATVALANKTARVAWAVMSTEQAYRRAA